MIISDLNFLEGTNEEIFGGGSRGRGGVNIDFKKKIDIYVDADYKVDTNVKANVSGNTAIANAYAYGKDSFSETYTEAVEDRYSFSESAAVVK